MEEFTKLVGKTIARVVCESRENEVADFDVVTVTFTDGTFVEFESWDHEGYRSGITVGEVS